MVGRHGGLTNARVDPPREGAYWDGLRAVRLAFAAFIGVDSLASISGEALGAPGAGDVSVVQWMGGVAAIVATVAVMWGRRVVAVPFAVLAFALIPVAGATGAEVYFLAASTVVAMIRERWRQAALSLAGLIGFVVIYAAVLAVFDLMPGSAGPLYRLMYYLIVIGVSALVTLPLRLYWMTYHDRMERARRHRADAALIRAAERARLSGDLRDVIEAGLDRITALSGASGIDDSEQRGRLDAIASTARETLTALRSLLGVLRSGDDAGNGEPRSAVRRAVLAFPALSLGMALGLFPLVIAPGLMTERLALLCALVGLALAGVDLRMSIALATIALVSTIPLPAMGRLSTLTLAAILAGTAGARRSVKAAAHLVLVLAAFSLTQFGVYGLAVAQRQAALVAGAALGFITGFTVAYVLAKNAQAEAELRRVEAANAREVSEVRAHVARELHDVVAHQLSLTTLEVLALTGPSSPDEIRGGLRRIHQYAQDAGRELDALVETLDSPAVLDDEPPLVSPVVMAENMRRMLAARGFHPHVTVAAGLADLDEISQRTLSRALQEAATNILRYAPQGSTCRVNVSVAGNSVTLRAVNPLPPGTPKRDPLSTGWGLRGLAERVELCHGVALAGATPDGLWLLEITLPLTGFVTDDVKSRTGDLGSHTQDERRSHT